MSDAPNPLEGILKNVIKKISKKRPSEIEIWDAWERAVGGAAARHSRPVSLQKSVLIVNVDMSTWLYELSTAQGEILKKLSLALKKNKVKDIRFRIGDITPPVEKTRGGL